MRLVRLHHGSTLVVGSFPAEGPGRPPVPTEKMKAGTNRKDAEQKERGPFFL